MGSGWNDRYKRMARNKNIKRIACAALPLLLVLLCFACSGTKENALINLPEQSAFAESDFGPTPEESKALFEDLFFASTAIDLSWKDGDDYSLVYEFWQNGQAQREASHLLPNAPAKRVGNGKTWQTRLVIGAFDAAKQRDVCSVYAGFLDADGMLQSSSTRSFPVDAKRVRAYAGNVFQYPDEGLQEDGGYLLLELLYLGDGLQADKIEDAAYGLRIYLRNAGDLL